MIHVIEKEQLKFKANPSYTKTHIIVKSKHLSLILDSKR